MKIIYTLASPEFTGPAEPIFYIAKNFVNEGNDVSFFNNSKGQGNLFELIRKEGFRQNENIIFSRHSLGFEIASDLYHLRKHFKVHQPDIIHSHFTHDHNLVTLACARLSSKPKIIRTLHTYHSVQRKIGRSWIFHNTDGFVFPCFHYQEIFKKNYPSLSSKKTAVISGGVDTNIFFPHSGLAIRKAYGISDNDFVLGIVSRIKPDRLHDNLICAFEKLSSLKNLYLFIVGRGESKREIELQVKKLHLESRVKFLGYRISDLSDVFASFDAHILLAEGNDGTCRAFLQAMSSGNALLSPNTGALGEANIEGVTGYHFDSHDSDSIATAIHKIFTGGLLDTFKRSAREQAVSRYYQEKPFLETKTFYANIITAQN